MKTVIIVALLLTSILLLGRMEVAATNGCIEEAKYYNVNWRSSNGDQGTDCVVLCFYLGSASLHTCSGHDGEFIAEDLTTDLQNYVGEIEGDPCHLQLRKYLSRDVLELDCAHINLGTELRHARGVLVDSCGCNGVQSP